MPRWLKVAAREAWAVGWLLALAVGAWWWLVGRGR